MCTCYVGSGACAGASASSGGGGGAGAGASSGAGAVLMLVLVPKACIHEVIVLRGALWRGGGAHTENECSTYA